MENTLNRRAELRRVSVAAFLLISLSANTAPSSGIPDLSAGGAGWLNTHNDFILPRSGPGPVTWDPAHPYFGNGDGPRPTARVADLANPILMRWVRDALKTFNDDALAGKPQFTPIARCWPNGVPGAILLRVNPMYIVQSANEVVFLYQSDHQIRHVYMNVPHSKSVMPSWYGESIGHYEGDTLVVDTIGQNTQTFVDNYRTPHSEKLHVVERFHIINDGKNLKADIFLEDPATFKQPLHVTHTWRRAVADERGDRGQSPLGEQSCAEAGPGNFEFSTNPNVVEPIPTAAKADF